MQETKKLIQKYYDSFNNNDMNSFLDCLTDDVVHDINQGTTEVGKKAFAKFMQHMAKCYRETAKELVIMVNEDETRAAAEFFIDGKYIKTDGDFVEAVGQTYFLRVGAFFAIKNDKIQRVTNYYNLKHWMTQVKNEP